MYYSDIPCTRSTAVRFVSVLESQALTVANFGQPAGRRLSIRDTSAQCTHIQTHLHATALLPCRLSAGFAVYPNSSKASVVFKVDASESIKRSVSRVAPTAVLSLNRYNLWGGGGLSQVEPMALGGRCLRTGRTIPPPFHVSSICLAPSGGVVARQSSRVTGHRPN